MERNAFVYLLRSFQKEKTHQREEAHGKKKERDESVSSLRREKKKEIASYLKVPEAAPGKKKKKRRRSGHQEGNDRLFSSAGERHRKWEGTKKFLMQERKKRRPLRKCDQLGREGGQPSLVSEGSQGASAIATGTNSTLTSGRKKEGKSLAVYPLPLQARRLERKTAPSCEKEKEGVLSFSHTEKKVEKKAEKGERTEEKKALFSLSLGENEKEGRGVPLGKKSAPPEREEKGRGEKVRYREDKEEKVTRGGGGKKEGKKKSRILNHALGEGNT